MRYREPFTVYPRRLPSGLIVYYYQTYDENGKRTAPRSTGQKSKGAARQECFRLMKIGSLIPARGDTQFFLDYAKDWWDWDKCAYLAYRRTRRRITRSYADMAALALKKHILPYFGKKRLKEINVYQIEKWMVAFQERGYMNATINACLGYLRVMLGFAVYKGDLKKNPAERVTPLKKSSRAHDVLTAVEVKALFDTNRIEEIWGERMYYVANLLAACTGMRKAEIVGVRKASLQNGYILVDKQYHRSYGLVDTKTDDARRIPLPEALMEELCALQEKNGEGYLFSKHLGEKPISGQTLNNRLRMALVKIGVSKEDQKDRYITFHSWRHYFNTVLRTNNISDGKVQSLTGHKSQAMTEHYTHFKPEDYDDVKAVQNEIIPFTKAG